MRKLHTCLLLGLVSAAAGLSGCARSADPAAAPAPSVGEQIRKDKVEKARDRFKVDGRGQHEIRGALAPADEEKDAPLQKLDKSTSGFDALHYKVFLDFPDLSFNDPRVSGEVQLTFKPIRKTSSLELESSGLSIRSVRLINTLQDLRFQARGEELLIDLGRRYQPDDTLTVSIAYDWKAAPNRGLYFRSRPGKTDLEAVFSQGQPEESKFWFPGNSKPDDMATFESVIRVAAPFVAVSNGALVGVDEKDGVRTYHWSQRQPMVSYLFAAAVGRFGQIQQKWRNIPVDFYGPADDLARLGYSLRNTLPALDFMSGVTGIDYPYEKYAQIVLPEYFIEGMEHTTATMLTDDVLHTPELAAEFGAEELLVHELAHQWFGNLATCRSWDHLWLNEGFASYFQVLFLEKVQGDPEAALQAAREAADWYFEEEDESPRPVVFDRYREDLDYYFDSRSYAKGAWVLHMLRREIGDKAFFATIRQYIQKNRGQLVETARLKEVAEEVSRRKLGWFFEQWLERPGYPVLKANWKYDPRKKELRIQVAQAQDRGRKDVGRAPLFQGTLPVEVDGVVMPGWLRDEETQEFRIVVDRAPRFVHLNSGSAWLAKVEMTQDLAAWTAQLRLSRDSEARIAAAEELSGKTDALAALETCAHDDPVTRVRAACALALGSENSAVADRAQNVLAALLLDPAWEVRSAAATALAYFPAQKAFDALKETIFEDESPSVRAEAMKALGRLKLPGTFDVAVEAAQIPTQEEVLLQAALKTLGSLGDPRAVALARQAALGPYHRKARKAALGVLGSMLRLKDAAFESQRNEARSALNQFMKQERDLMLLLQAKKLLGK